MVYMWIPFKTFESIHVMSIESTLDPADSQQLTVDTVNVNHSFTLGFSRRTLLVLQKFIYNSMMWYETSRRKEYFFALFTTQKEPYWSPRFTKLAVLPRGHVDHILASKGHSNRSHFSRYFEKQANRFSRFVVAKLPAVTWTQADLPTKNKVCIKKWLFIINIIYSDIPWYPKTFTMPRAEQFHMFLF